MALTKIPRGLLDTGVADSSDATAITIDSSENVTFAGHIRFADDKKTIFGTGDDLHIYHTGGHNYIDVSTADQDLIFKGTDGGSDITALTLDMSEAGAATFSSDLTVQGGLTVDTSTLKVDSTNNRVGIGDTTPQALLDVGGGYGSNTTVATFAHATDAYIEIENMTTQNGAGIILTNAGTKKWTIQKDTSAHSLHIQDTSGDVMKFLQGGHVLIGADSGDAFNADSMLRLQRTGDRVFVQIKTDTDQDSGILFGTTSDDVHHQILHDVSEDKLVFKAQSAETMVLDAGSHVGIKTSTEADGTAMTSPLTISGANDGGNIFEAHRTANSIHRQYMSSAGSSYIDIYGTTPILKFRIGGSDVLDIRASRLDGIHFYSGTDEITSTMDNLKTAGFYRIQNNAGGQPISGNYGAACVFGNQGNVTTQIWSQLQTSNLYVRSFNNAWSSWTAL